MPAFLFVAAVVITVEVFNVFVFERCSDGELGKTERRARGFGGRNARGDRGRARADRDDRPDSLSLEPGVDGEGQGLGVLLSRPRVHRPEFVSVAPCLQRMKGDELR